MISKRLSDQNLLSEREKQNRDFISSLISFLQPLVRKQEAYFGFLALFCCQTSVGERVGFFLVLIVIHDCAHQQVTDSA